MSSEQKISCIILAGGEGKRAGGRDKGLIPYKGKPVIQHVIDTVRPQVDEIVISANRNMDSYRSFTETVISDKDKVYRGPLAGLAASVPACKHKLIFVAACDMPALPNDIVRRLTSGMDKKKISIAACENKLQLALLFQRSLLTSIQRRLIDDELSLMHWARSQTPAIITFDDATLFANLNLNEDYT